MDMQMASSTQGSPSSFPTWDFQVDSMGQVPMIFGDPESVQAATIAAFIQVGSVPQLPGVGVPWAEFLTGGASFGDLDAAIRQAAKTAGVSNFAPQYSIVNEQLVVTMQASKRIT